MGTWEDVCDILELSALLGRSGNPTIVFLMNLVELFDWQALSARTGLKAQKIHETSQDFALEVFLQIRCCRVLSEVCKPGPGQCPGQCPGWQYLFCQSLDGFYSIN